MKNKKRALRDRILEEMAVDYANTLEKSFDLAKKFVKITSDGRVDVVVKDQIRGQDKILLYLIGKVYAKEAGKVKEELVGNEELQEELGIGKGSLLPWLKRLRDKNKIKSLTKVGKSFHKIPLNQIEKTLKRMDKKLGGVD